MTNQPRTARPRKMVRRSILLAVAVIAATFGIGLAEPEAERAVDAAPQAAAATVTTLVLYDSTGPYAWLGDIYAVQTANLAGHFGTVTRKKVTAYAKGDIAKYTATIYVGSTYDEPLPAAFLSDVTSATKPVIWVADNIWQLTAATPTFAADFGWMWSGYDTRPVSKVAYKGATLTRSALNNAGIMNSVVYDPAKAKAVATAVADDGTQFPWAIRSKNLTYVGENPYSYISETDRYLAWLDLLFDALAPQTAERHRAMIRIEDVGPTTDPTQLRQIVDYLYSKKIKFTLATYSWYRDPRGVNNGGKAVSTYLYQSPKLTSALRYAQARGGTVIQHGRTHQLDSLINPYDGVSANDFEFYRAHVDAATDAVVLDGPVANDSTANAKARIQSGRTDFALALVPVSNIFEFPHYAASEADYQAVKALNLTAYDRRLYFPRNAAGKADTTRPTGQFFPYVVTDVYGTKVIPENMGNYEPEAYNQHPAVLIPELVQRARTSLVVRDGFASYFYHPFLGVEPLKQLVEGVNAIGRYTWVGPNDV